MASEKKNNTAPETEPFEYEPAECFDKVKRRGRPKLILNAVGQRVVEALGAVMATEEEIAAAQEQIRLQRAVENIGISQANIRAGAGGDRSGRNPY